MVHRFGNILVVHNSGFHYDVSIYAQCSVFVSIHTKTLPTLVAPLSLPNPSFILTSPLNRVGEDSRFFAWSLHLNPGW